MNDVTQPQPTGLRALWQDTKEAFREGKEAAEGLIDGVEAQFEALSAETGEPDEGYGGEKKKFVLEALELLLGAARFARVSPLLSALIDTIVLLRNLRGIFRSRRTA